jgi:erythromycin esterase
MRQTLILLLFFISGTFNVHGQDGTVRDIENQKDSNNIILEWVKSNAIPVSTVEPNDDISDLHLLKPIIGNSRLVAYGEPTHGAHEPLAFRNRLFKYLVKEMNFSGIVLETGLPESRYINDFVLGKRVDIDQVLKYFTWGFGSLEENKDLLLWMRKYNSNTTYQQKIRFYGMDVSWSPKSKSTSFAIEQVLNYLQRVDTTSYNKFQTDFQPYLNNILNTEKETETFTTENHDRFTVTIDDLIAMLQRSRPEFIKLTSDEDYSWALQIAVMVRQSDRIFRLEPKVSATVTPGTLPSHVYLSFASRDMAMAENVKWALERSGTEGKLLIFAHNGHIINGKLNEPRLVKLELLPNCLGSYLRSYFGDEIFIIGTSSANNGDGFPIAINESNSLDHLLSQIDLKQYLLNFKTAISEPDISSWLLETRILRANLTSYIKIVPIEAFDMMMFIDTLTPSK